MRIFGFIIPFIKVLTNVMSVHQKLSYFTPLQVPSPALFLTILLGFLVCPFVLHAQGFYAASILNLDAESGHLTINATFPNGEYFGNKPGGF